jgi:hypothetical protein
VTVTVHDAFAKEENRADSDCHLSLDVIWEQLSSGLYLPVIKNTRLIGARIFNHRERRHLWRQAGKDAGVPSAVCNFDSSLIGLNL